MGPCSRCALGFFALCWVLFPLSHSSVYGFSNVRGVNLGGWLVVEGWIKPSLSDEIPNGDMLDGTQVQFKSTTLQKYVSTENGGGANVTVDRDVPSTWETFKKHRSTFVTEKDFAFLSQHGINTVRIPVGWWIYRDPDPPAPYIGGSLSALDKAFLWAQAYSIKCIIDLHAAPGSQNGMEHSASRDGSVNWPQPEYIAQTLDVIDFLSARYGNHPALLGVELLNEPSAAAVPIDVLISYYIRGYQIVRGYSSTAYVIVCQRIGNADPLELYQANIGDSNVVVDLHYYNLFDTFFNNTSVTDNIQFIYKSRESQLQSLNSANGPLVFIGEWVNEWNSKNASQMDYQMFGSAQLEVYNTASSGWSYWTLKNDEEHWDFEWNIQNKYLILGSSSRRTPRKSYLLVLTCVLFFLTYSGMIH